MRESIYTIPVNDVFGEPEGCPVCRMRRILETRCMDFITGAAMMEPDVRISTNRYGFCESHLELLSKQKNRLSVALMLETHLDELMEKQLPPKGKRGEPGPADTCFVCREIEQAGENLSETAIRLWKADPDFRHTMRTREFYCLRDYSLLCRLAEETLNRKEAALFAADITEPTRRYMEKLRDDVHSFSLLFDYRNAGKAQENDRVKTAIERAREFLK